MPDGNRTSCLIRAATVVAGLCAFGVCAEATAADLDADRIELRQEGRSVLLTATPRASVFAFADEDGDGLLSRDEVWAHRATMLSRLHTGVVVSDQDGAAGSIDYEEILVPDTGTLGGATYVRVVQRRQYSAAPAELSLSYGLFTEPDQSVTVRGGVQRGGREVASDATVLRPDAPTFTFATGASASVEPQPEPRDRNVDAALVLGVLSIATLLGVGYSLRHQLRPMVAASAEATDPALKRSHDLYY